LAPFAVRFVVAAPGSLPSSTIRRLNDQVDMDPSTANGLVIYRNAVALPPAAALELDDVGTRLLASSDLSSIERLGSVDATAFTAVPGGWDGPASAKGVPFIATEFSGGWTLDGVPPVRAFGWATAFPGAPGVSGTDQVRHGADFLRTLELWVLGALWLAALWITRKPVVR
jgi:hypothetical protein